MHKLLFGLVVVGAGGCGGGGMDNPDAGEPGADAEVTLVDAADDPPDGSGPCGPRQVNSDDPRLAAAMDALDARLASTGFPGGALAVIEGDDVYLGTVGVKTAGGCDPIGFDSRFSLGLIAEVVTAIALLDAEEDAQIDIGAPATDYIDFTVPTPADAGAITIADLLLERDGLGPPTSASSCDLETFGGLEFAAWAPPGRVGRWSLQSANLAGAVLATLGTSYAAEVGARVFGPLDVSATFSSTTAESGDHADGHFPENRALRVQHIDALGQCEANQPSHRLYGGIRDGAAVARLLVDGGGVLGAAALDKLLDATVSASLHSAGTQSLGFYGYEFQPGLHTVWQGSQSAGYGQHLELVRERDLAVVVLSNGQDSMLQEVARAALTAFQSDLAFPYSYTPDSSGWGDYVASWVDPIGVGAGPRTLDVAFDGTTLTATVDGTDYLLTPSDGDDMFTATMAGQTVALRFWRDDSEVPDLLSGIGPTFYRQ